jgi:hypothetical protein
MPTSGAGDFTATRFLVYGGPGASLCLFLPEATILVALLDMLSLTFLLVGIAALVSAWHGGTSASSRFSKEFQRGCRERASMKIQPFASIAG